jgi:hypothetical protein
MGAGWGPSTQIPAVCIYLDFCLSCPVLYIRLSRIASHSDAIQTKVVVQRRMQVCSRAEMVL